MEGRAPLLDAGPEAVGVGVDGSPGSIELTPVPSFNMEPESDEDTGDNSGAVGGAGESRRCCSRCRRIGTCYLIYCVTCFSVASFLFVATVAGSFASRHQIHDWRRELRPKEVASEIAIGVAMCGETIFALYNMGAAAFFRNHWRLLDAAVASITLICGFLLVLRRFARGARHVVEDVDLPILALRFALQPVRVLSTASMVVRAHRYRRHRRMVQVDLLEATSNSTTTIHRDTRGGGGMERRTEKEEALPLVFDPRRPTPPAFRSALTPSLASKIREALPACLQYLDWHLAYAPQVHGVSLKTFYRQQKGPNILAIRDVHGNLFGAFASEAWRPQSGAYGTGESFVFATHRRPQEASWSLPTQVADGVAGSDESPGPGPATASLGARPEDDPEEVELKIFPATMQKGAVIQWGDLKMLGMGRALVVHEDFLRGTSGACESFASPPLSQQELMSSTCEPISASAPRPSPMVGSDFVVRDFECWLVGHA